MNDTVRTPPATEPPRCATLDDLVADSIPPKQLEALSAYQWAAGGALVTWLAKGSE